MEASEVIAMVQQEIPDAKVTVDGEDCSFSLVVISEQFAGVPPLKRQQTVLKPFSALITAGTLHALTVKAITSAEWEKQQSSNLVQL